MLDSQQLTDSDAEPSPPSKIAKMDPSAKSHVLSPFKGKSLLTLKDLSDSDNEDEEPSDIEIAPKDPVEACKVAFPILEETPRDRAFRMAEVFSGSGILSEEMSALGFVTRNYDYLTGGSDHDVSDALKATNLCLVFWSQLLILCMKIVST